MLFYVRRLATWHLLEVGGVPHTNWKQGQWFKFKCDRTISYANVGKKKMYMIEVLGKESLQDN